jgi:hypothetical protein
VQIVVTFHLVCFAWIFFRAGSIGDAGLLIQNLFSGTSTGLLLPTVGARELVLSLGVIGILVGMHLFERRGDMRRVLATHPLWVRSTVYAGLLLGVMLLGQFESQQFIYFQF